MAMMHVTRLVLISLLIGSSAPPGRSEPTPQQAAPKPSLAPEPAPPPSPAPAPTTPAAPAVFKAAERAVSSWRAEAAANLDVTPDVAAELLAGDKPVARCIKLNNYWCIKKAGWTGEIAADSEGHVAFSTAAEGAAVAALLLKRYYVDFKRKTAMAIIAHWAPAQCGAVATGPRIVAARRGAPRGLGGTLRGRWLSAHARGFATPARGVGKASAKPRQSVVADRMPRLMPVPSIAVGLGEKDRVMKPMTLDALLQSSPNAPRSRSMLGMPSASMPMPATSCASDSARIASYAAKAATGLRVAPDGDLGLFDGAGVPTDNLATMMANMARVEIGPLAANAALIKTGIADAFRPGRNPS